MLNGLQQGPLTAMAPFASPESDCCITRCRHVNLHSLRKFEPRTGSKADTHGQ